MSNTIRTTSSFTFIRSGVTRAQIPNQQADIATTSEIQNDTVQTVGVTHELVVAGDATDECFARIENLHATAEIQIGGDDAGAFVPWITIAAGDPPAIIPRLAVLAATYLQSDTALTPIRITLCKIS